MNYTKLSQEHINSLQQIVGKDDVYTDHENLEKYGHKVWINVDENHCV